MSYSGFKRSQKEDKKTISSRAKHKISIIVSEWNRQITSKLLEGAVETLTKKGILKENIFITKVPGSFELIFEAKKKSKDSKFDSIIVIGCLIKGETNVSNRTSTRKVAASPRASRFTKNRGLLQTCCYYCDPREPRESS